MAEYYQKLNAKPDTSGTVSAFDGIGSAAVRAAGSIQALLDKLGLLKSYIILEIAGAHSAVVLLFLVRPRQLYQACALRQGSFLWKAA